MATTSLWHIKGRLKDLTDYVENPEKTAAKTSELQDLYNVFSYVQRPEATQEGEYVTAINCLKETALRQMILTKKRYGKTDGYIAWHGYQSFKPEEVTPQLAHEIGVKLAKEMDCYTEDKKKQLAAKRRELSKAKKRMAEIDTLIQRIYGDNASGKLSDERYATMSRSYEEEQITLKAAVPEMQAYLEAETDKTESLQRFIQKVKQVTELKALTPELIHEFVDKIVVYAPRYLDGKRVQLLDIYYSGVGILHELTPEEMEEAFQHHLAERNKEKTA